MSITALMRQFYLPLMYNFSGKYPKKINRLSQKAKRKRNRQLNKFK